jgi:hypothetical protein
MTNKNMNIYIVATKVETARHLLKKINIMLQNMQLNFSTIINNKDEIQLVNGSTITVISSYDIINEKIEKPIDFILFDEACYINNLDKLILYSESRLKNLNSQMAIISSLTPPTQKQSNHIFKLL